MLKKLLDVVEAEEPARTGGNRPLSTRPRKDRPRSAASN